jgi:hypothetical protein
MVIDPGATLGLRIERENAWLSAPGFGIKLAIRRSAAGGHDMALGSIALIATALFTGAAFYISFAEHPARMSLTLPEALRQWKHAYERGLQMQVMLVIISATSGLLAAIITGDPQWLLGALAIAANVPYTLIVMMPTNNELKDTAPVDVNEATRVTLDKWGRMHAVRTALGAFALVVYWWAL